MENAMTDYQFKSIMTMVLKIIKRADDLEDAIKSVEELIEGENKDKNESKDNK